MAPISRFFIVDVSSIKLKKVDQFTSCFDSLFLWFSVCIFFFFKGLIQTGAWVIFYDFNCIAPNVLSVVAQQMLTIQSAKAQHAIKVVFQETTLKLDASCGVFVTINPDYPGNIDGRWKNLKLKHEYICTQQSYAALPVL